MTAPGFDLPSFLRLANVIKDGTTYLVEIAFYQLIADQERSQWEADQSAFQGRNVTVLEQINGSYVPAPQRAFYMPLGFSRTPGLRIGFNALTDARRGSAVVAAMHDNTMAITQPNPLLTGVFGISAFLPLYNTTMTGTDTSAAASLVKQCGGVDNSTTSAAGVLVAAIDLPFALHDAFVSPVGYSMFLADVTATFTGSTSIGLPQDGNDILCASNGTVSTYAFSDMVPFTVNKESMTGMLPQGMALLKAVRTLPGEGPATTSRLLPTDAVQAWMALDKSKAATIGRTFQFADRMLAIIIMSDVGLLSGWTQAVYLIAILGSVVSLATAAFVFAALSAASAVRGVAMAHILSDNKALAAAERSHHRTITYASHNLRNPLNVISNVFKLLVEAYTFGHEDTENVYAARVAITKMQAVLDDINDFSAIDSGAIRPVFASVPVRKAISHVVAQQVLSDPPKVPIRWSVHASVPPRIYTDALRFAQIVGNGLDFACKNAKGGSVDIEVTMVDKQGTSSPQHTADRAVTTDGYTVLSVLSAAPPTGTAARLKREPGSTSMDRIFTTGGDDAPLLRVSITNVGSGLRRTASRLFTPFIRDAVLGNPRSSSPEQLPKQGVSRKGSGGLHTDGTSRGDVRSGLQASAVAKPKVGTTTSLVGGYRRTSSATSIMRRRSITNAADDAAADPSAAASAAALATPRSRAAAMLTSGTTTDARNASASISPTQRVSYIIDTANSQVSSSNASAQSVGSPGTAGTACAASSFPARLRRSLANATWATSMMSVVSNWTPRARELLLPTVMRRYSTNAASTSPGITGANASAMGFKRNFLSMASVDRGEDLSIADRAIDGGYGLPLAAKFAEILGGKVNLFDELPAAAGGGAGGAMASDAAAATAASVSSAAAAPPGHGAAVSPAHGNAVARHVTSNNAVHPRASGTASPVSGNTGVSVVTIDANSINSAATTPANFNLPRSRRNASMSTASQPISTSVNVAPAAAGTAVGGVAAAAVSPVSASASPELHMIHTVFRFDLPLQPIPADAPLHRYASYDEDRGDSADATGEGNAASCGVIEPVDLSDTNGEALTLARGHKSLQQHLSVIRRGGKQSGFTPRNANGANGGPSGGSLMAWGRSTSINSGPGPAVEQPASVAITDPAHHTAENEFVALTTQDANEMLDLSNVQQQLVSAPTSPNAALPGQVPGHLGSSATSLSPGALIADPAFHASNSGATPRGPSMPSSEALAIRANSRHEFYTGTASSTLDLSRHEPVHAELGPLTPGSRLQPLLLPIRERPAFGLTVQTTPVPLRMGSTGGVEGSELQMHGSAGMRHLNLGTLSPAGSPASGAALLSPGVAPLSSSAARAQLNAQSLASPSTRKIQYPSLTSPSYAGVDVRGSLEVMSIEKARLAGHGGLSRASSSSARDRTPAHTREPTVTHNLGLRVLYADDEATNRRLMTSIVVKRLGCEIVALSDGTGVIPALVASGQIASGSVSHRNVEPAAFAPAFQPALSTSGHSSGVKFRRTGTASAPGSPVLAMSTTATVPSASGSAPGHTLSTVSEVEDGISSGSGSGTVSFHSDRPAGTPLENGAPGRPGALDILAVTPTSSVSSPNMNLDALPRSQRFDCILLDVVMTSLHGDTLTRQLRQQYGIRLPIIAVTANAHDVKYLQECGFDTVLPKPLDAGRLADVLSKVRMQHSNSLGHDDEQVVEASSPEPALQKQPSGRMLE